MISKRKYHFCATLSLTALKCFQEKTGLRPRAFLGNSIAGISWNTIARFYSLVNLFLCYLFIASECFGYNGNIKFPLKLVC